MNWWTLCKLALACGRTDILRASIESELQIKDLYHRVIFHGMRSRLPDWGMGLIGVLVCCSIKAEPTLNAQGLKGAIL